MKTPAELAAHISLELRETDSPSLTYEDWATIKAALREPATEVVLEVRQGETASPERPQSGEMVMVPRTFLEEASCANCDGSGFSVNTGPDPQQEQCQWCYEKNMLLAAAEAERGKT